MAFRPMGGSLLQSGRFGQLSFLHVQGLKDNLNTPSTSRVSACYWNEDKRRDTSMPIFIWLILAAGCLFLLQLFPVTGIFLMFFGAGVITGVLFFLSLLSLLFEALMKRVPRWLVVVPIAAAGGYYVLFVYERLTLPSLPVVAGLEQTSGGLIFDPEQHAIDYRSIDPNYLLARYQVPRIYYSNFSKVRTVGETRVCEMLGSGPSTPGEPIGMRVGALNQFFCFSSEDENVPREGLITFEHRFSDLMISGISTRIRTLVVLLEGEEIGSISNLRANVLSPIPLLFAGCGLISNPPSWECGVRMFRDWVEVWPISASTNGFALSQAVETDQVAELLSLAPRSVEEVNAMTRLMDSVTPD